METLPYLLIFIAIATAVRFVFTVLMKSSPSKKARKDKEKRMASREFSQRPAQASRKIIHKVKDYEYGTKVVTPAFYNPEWDECDLPTWQRRKNGNPAKTVVSEEPQKKTPAATQKSKAQRPPKVSLEEFKKNKGMPAAEEI